MKKILVTGANGFIGKNVTKKLLENNSVDVYCRELKKDDPSWIKDAYRQMKITLDAIKAMGIKTIISFPNSDAGGLEIIKAIEEYDSLPFICTAKNIPRVDFVNLLRNAACLVGNSSSGILEAPLLRLPVINIGNRQIGRLHAENVQFVPHEKSAIVGAIQTAVYDESYISVVNRCGNPYGDGNSSYKIANIIADTVIDEKLLIKDITY